MNEIKPNSHKYKEESKVETKEPVKLQPVIAAGKARTKKKGGFSKLTSNIISGDAQNVKSYIVMDVLIPAFKKAVSDIVTNGIDIILYGETGHSKKSNAGRVSYGNYYNSTSDRFGRGGVNRDPRDTRDRIDNRSRGPVSLFDDVIVDTMGEGKDILSRMSEYLEVYPVISVAHLYDLANITNFPHTYNNYGWKSVVDADVVRVPDGYLLKMPPVQPIK